MSYKIRCHTLFDITQTGVLNRRLPQGLPDEKAIKLEQERKTQCNFDTVIQVISLRSQPENITVPISYKTVLTDVSKFGFLFEEVDIEQNCWMFDFNITHASVFSNGIDELGALFQDCNGVPMIKVGNEFDKLSSFLDTSPELRNIYFEVL